MHARVIQLVALVILVVCTGVCGQLLPTIRAQTEEHGLRYTDVSVEGAPPFVALGTAIGALRGLIVDYLWIKVNMMKEKGLFYEVMADAELITKLQPRFAAVWAFHGHNMAYNISVASNTQEERWRWVNAGIRLVRDQGLRHNPNDLVLHKELAFWFAHKIEGYSDDAHLYYKHAFCREWHFLLGPPPPGREDYLAWLGGIAEAPESLEQAERRTPGVRALVQRLNTTLTPFGEDQEFEPSKQFLNTYALWRAVRDQSETAKMLDVETDLRKQSPFFNAFDEIGSDPDVQEPLQTLVQFVQKRVLLDDYNMDPQLMYKFAEELAPIDWRNGQAHALYWSRRGEMFGEPRVASEDEVYKILNNDRTQLQAMQGLARYGRISFDPFSAELPSRFPEPRWIDVIDEEFDHFYAKHFDTRGGGGETFIAFLKNFMGSAIREAYRSGEHARAQKLLERMDARFGQGELATNEYAVPLKTFVREQVKGEYTFQPHLAPSEAVASLRAAYRMGVGFDDRKTYDEAMEFVNDVIEYFQSNEYNNYVTRFGTGRMRDLLDDLHRTREAAFLQLMIDPTVHVKEKAAIWANIDKYDPELRYLVYDEMTSILSNQFAQTALSRERTYEDLFPAPPNYEVVRPQIQAARLRAEELRHEQIARDEMEQK